MTPPARDEGDRAGVPAVDLGALSEMLAPAFPARRVIAAERLSGGLANATFKVSMSGAREPVVVRVYVRDTSAVSREAAILDLVKERVPVPEVFYVSLGAPGAPAYIVLGWTEGVTLEEMLAAGPSAEAEQAARATGTVLARLQEFRFARSGFLGDGLDVRTPFPSAPRVVTGVLEQFLFRDCGAERLGSVLAQRLWRFVADHEALLGVVEHHAMLVHGDFNGLNVIVRTSSGRPEVAALIDWEYAHSGTPLVDLGGILRRPGRHVALWYEDAVVRGYREEGGVLPENWRQVATIVDLVKLCAFVRSPNAGEVAVEHVRAIVEAALAGEAA